jgi:hypothetical protein
MESRIFTTLDSRSLQELRNDPFAWPRAEREPNEASPPNVTATPKTPRELEAEIKHLREENAKLLEQREVLKKSLGILCETPPRGMPKSNA